MKIFRTWGLLWPLLCAGCRITRSDTPEWLEAPGEAQLTMITGSPEGVFGVGTNQRLYKTPGAFGQPWLDRGPLEAQSMAASPRALYALMRSRAVVRIAGSNRQEIAPSASWQATAIAVNEADQLFVLAGGVRKVVGDKLMPGPCPDIQATAIAAAGKSVYVVDAQGQIFQGTDAGCAPVPGPGAAVTRLAARGDELFAVIQGGRVARRRGAWQTLPAPIHRPKNAKPRPGKVVDVTTTDYQLWARDEEGTTYVLSDPT